MDNYLDCPCLSVIPIDRQCLLEKFESIREKCPALKEILVPDNVWPQFKEVAEKEMDEAKHFPILLSALRWGYLKKITSPVHKYLIENGMPKKKLKKQYSKDLIERWMISKDEMSKDELKQHHESKGYSGKLIELQIAEWLEGQDWKIDNLEALCGNYDIEATSPDKNEYAIEIKYIGEEDDKFLAIVEGSIPPDRFESLIKRLSKDGDKNKIDRLVEKCKSRTFDPYSGANYIIFRSYEAAKQLHKCAKKCIAVIVISNISWGFIELPIIDNWIDWHSPYFLDSCPQWDDFLEKNKGKYPDLTNDLKATVTNINQIWIVKQGNGFQYSLDKIIEFN